MLVIIKSGPPCILYRAIISKLLFINQIALFTGRSLLGSIILAQVPIFVLVSSLSSWFLSHAAMLAEESTNFIRFFSSFLSAFGANIFRISPFFEVGSWYRILELLCVGCFGRLHNETGACDICWWPLGRRLRDYFLARRSQLGWHRIGRGRDLLCLWLGYRLLRGWWLLKQFQRRRWLLLHSSQLGLSSRFYLQLSYRFRNRL